MSGPVQIAFSRDGARAALTLVHPKGNIVTRAMLRALLTALEQLAQEPHLKLVTIAGAGADFSFGASIPEHTPAEIVDALPLAHEAIYTLIDLPAVTAAVVRGRCLGGGFELALACDFIFAAESAVLGLPEIALGVFPPAASALLPPRIGSARATRAIVTGEARPARAWEEAGLVSMVTEDDDLEAAVDRWFDRHAAPRSASALRFAASAARLSLARHVRAVLPELERLYLDGLMRTTDAAEGIAAFLEKRPPEWTDR
ncbi:MAG: enoyl-CoA hydratase/isomerase family protein [Vicinamibacterales bacterium]